MGGGDKWVAVGSGGNTIAYSFDGVVWTGLGSTVPNAFDVSGYDVTWNGIRWVAVGQNNAGASNIMYSSDGIIWVPIPSIGNFFNSFGHGVCWNGVRFIAVGADLNPTTITMKYSPNGIIWYDSPSNPTIFTVAGAGSSVGWGVNSNPTIGTPVIDSQIVLNPSGFRLSNNLDVNSEQYFNGGIY